MLRYTMTSTGYSSARYGRCEVCHCEVSEVWHLWVDEITDGRLKIVGEVFGHEGCLKDHERALAAVADVNAA